MSTVVVYTKDGCHLYERVTVELLKLGRERSFEISIIDITTNSRLLERYQNVIPVVAVDGKVRLAGAALAKPNTLEDTLRRVLFPL